MKIVLVLNSNPRNLSLAATRLLTMGINIVTASIEEDAFEVARRMEPWLILLDIAPQEEPWRPLRQLKSDPVMAKIPVIITSTRTSESDQEKARSLGAVAYITKPYDVEQLRQLVMQFMAPPSPPVEVQPVVYPDSSL